MPLKTQNYIHSFLDNCDNDLLETSDYDVSKWNKYYYFFTETKQYRTSDIVKGISRILLLKPQQWLKINRWRNCKNQYKDDVSVKWAWQWFSIKNETVKMVIDKEEYIYKHFCKTHCPDECWLYTMIYNFGERDKIISSKRNIIFTGKPSILDAKDFDRIMASDDFFARKFDENVDKEIIDRVYNYLVGVSDDK